MLDRVAVSRPCTAPIPEGGEAENAPTGIGGHHDRKATRGSRCEPSLPLIQRGRFQRIYRCRSGDYLVVNRQDCWEVTLHRRTHAYHFILSGSMLSYHLCLS